MQMNYSFSASLVLWRNSFTYRTALLAAVLTTVTSPLSMLAADIPGQSVKDFDLGGVVGACLVVKCEAFQGMMVTDQPSAGEPVKIAIHEWLLGGPVPSETILVPYDDKPHRRGLGGTAVAWQNARISTNVPVTVLMALETNAEVVAGEPVLVTFDERDAGIIRSVIDEAKLLKRNPSLISAEVASLSAKSSPAIAGYLLHYVLFTKDINEIGRPAQLLIDLLGNPGVPAERWVDIPYFLLSYSGSLPLEGRLRMVRRFVDLAERDDDNASRAGFLGLGGIANDPQNELRGMIPSAALAALSARYHSLLQQRKIGKMDSLDVMLAPK
jgi:hypothetical protein